MDVIKVREEREMEFENIKIAYIGGGSRAWARKMMCDLALNDKIGGEVRLYDIDIPAAKDNQVIGELIEESGKGKSHWRYKVFSELGAALDGADFVLCSILPGTFDEMESDVHAPNLYGLYQSVGDTVGPGGILRAMRTVPIYEGFAAAIREHCPNAFVINFTNPMSLCTATLYDVYPKIRAFGCCHEVFGTQEFLARVAEEMLGFSKVERHEVKVDVLGVNHFTWFTSAECRGVDLFPVYREYIRKHMWHNTRVDGDVMSSKEYVKMDLFMRYGQIAAAGDRHLAEFMNGAWYIGSPEKAEEWGFVLTSVDWRRNDRDEKVKKTKALVAGKEKVDVQPSGEEFMSLILALCGKNDCVSNVNLLNCDLVPWASKTNVIETNAVFECGKITPLKCKPLNKDVELLVSRVAHQQENLLRGIRNRDLNSVFDTFMSEPLCSKLTLKEGKELFEKMIQNTEKYLGCWEPDKRKVTNCIGY